MNFLRFFTCLFVFALCGNTLSGLAAPVKDEITMEEALETNAFAPTYRDKIPSQKDKVIGKWSWETAEKDPALDDLPHPKKPCKDNAKINAWIAKIDDILNGDPKRTKAARIAEFFPGVPQGEVELIERTVEIDPAVGGWHSLGLYAPPGAKITVSVKGKTKFDMDLRIGCHTDFITKSHLEQHHDNTQKRPPKMTNTVRIKAGEKKAELANPFGGLIYLDVKGVHPKHKPVRVEISGGIASPLFVLGHKDDKGIDIAVVKQEEWQKQLAECKAPWGEIAVPRLIFTVPAEHLRLLKVPRKLCKNLQRGMAVQDWLVGWDKYPDQIATPMRFVIDEQISVGYGHSGYPAMGYMDWGNCIKSGMLVKQGSWGLWHELGHNHQWAPFRFDGCTEVTVNLFSTISQTQAIGTSYEQAWDGTSIAPEDMKASVQAFLTKNNKTTFDKEEDVRLKLYFFVELMRGLGYDSFRKVALRHHEEQPFNNSTTNQERWDFFLVALAEATEKNLVPYFERWKIDVSEKAKNKVRNKFKGESKIWTPCKGYPRKLPTYAEEKAALAAEKEAERRAIIEKRKKERAEQERIGRRERAKKILEQH